MGAEAHKHPKTLFLAGHIKGRIHPKIKEILLLLTMLLQTCGFLSFMETKDIAELKVHSSLFHSVRTCPHAAKLHKKQPLNKTSLIFTQTCCMTCMDDFHFEVKYFKFEYV